MRRRTFPTGRAFLRTLAKIEDRCSRSTRARLPKLGRVAPQTEKHLGNVLSRLYREGCCADGCPGGDHFGQYVAGRVVSHALGAYRLLGFGYYDESFALTRNLGEAANLLFLFFQQPELADEWKRLDEGRRRQQFSALEVRPRLEAIGKGVIPINRTRYAGLCEAGVHVTPALNPQGHNPAGRPTLGGLLQEAGLLAALNELAGAVAVCGVGVSRFLGVPEERARVLRRESAALLRNIGAVDLEALRRRFQ